MNFELQGKVAIVTGGSRAIGRVAATTLAEEGAEVAIVSRDVGVAEGAAGRTFIGVSPVRAPTLWAAINDYVKPVGVKPMARLHPHLDRAPGRPLQLSSSTRQSQLSRNFISCSRNGMIAESFQEEARARSERGTMRA